MTDFWKNMLDIKLIETNDNINTYEANMKILVKKIKTKYQKEALFYKQKLISKTEYLNIYNIFFDEINNYLYFAYNPTEKEKMDEAINNKNIIIEKETTFEGHCGPLLKKNYPFYLIKKRRCAN